MSAKFEGMPQKSAAKGRGKGRAGGKSGPASGSRSGPASGPASGLFTRLGDLYRRMEEAYIDSARAAGLSCDNCADNCCTTYFQHHTHVEWAYLWRGLNGLSGARRDALRERAGRYIDEVRVSLAAGARPSAMCPLNEGGLCALYAHRLMICRMHGTRNVFTLPDGSTREFPGCARFTALPGAKNAPALDRTPFYRELAALEMEFLRRHGPLPRANLSIAEMIANGPPKAR